MIKILSKTDAWKVLNACRAGKKANKAALEYVHLTDKYLESTDGAMLFRSGRANFGIPSDAPAGVYEVVSAKAGAANFTEIALEIVPDAQYPNTDQIIPKLDVLQNTDKIALEPEKQSITSLSAAVIKLYKYTGNAYSVNLLERLTPMNESWSLCFTDRDKPAALVLNNRDAQVVAVIMNFKLDLKS